MSDKYTTFIVGVCFTVNYIIGTGFLTLPWAFNQTGWALGFLTLSLFTVLSVMVTVFILETMARAEELHNGDKVKYLTMSYVSGRRDYSAVADTSEHFATVSNSSRKDPHSKLNSEENVLILKEKLIVKETVYEIPELALIFLGKQGNTIYTIFVSLYLFSALWAYSSVFGLAFASNLYIGVYSYKIYVVLFSLFVVPVSLMEFKEQICVQVVLSLCRILMVLVMISTVLYARSNNQVLFGSYQYTSTKHESFSMENWRGVYLLLPIAAYANIFHHSIPALAHLVSDKSLLNQVFFTSLLISCGSYVALSGVVSSYFGNITKISANLNWADFHSEIGGTETAREVAKILSTFVVLFPAFDVASAFPLNAITLANNLMSTYDGLNVHQSENSRIHRTIFRLITVVPALVCAFFFQNLGEVTHFAGLSGFVIGFIFPALLAYYSKKRLDELDLPSDTIYSFNILSRWSNIATVFIGIGLLMFVGYCLIAIGPVSR